MRIFIAIALCVYGILTASAMAATEKPIFVVTSIKPVHALISGVMEGVAEPVLLVDKPLSPHDYALTPSNAAALEKADIIFFISRHLEHFLEATLPSFSKNNRTIIELAALPGIKLLPPREESLWAGKGDALPPNAQHLSHEETYDPHIWLDPRNAITIVEAASAALSRKDPAHSEHYKKNAHSMVKALAALDEKLRTKLAPYADIPYIVYHDAYHYFERRYNLHPIGAVTLHEETPPGARRIAELKDHITHYHVICLFNEPTSPTAITDLLVRETGVAIGTLDAEWGILAEDSITAQQGKNAYFTLMQRLMQNLIQCFDKKRSLMS